MELLKVILRSTQLVFVAVILGLGGSLVHGYFPGSHVSDTLSFTLAVGAFGAVAALIGLAAAFAGSLAGIITMIIDAIAILAYAAGGIALSSDLGVHSCTGSYPRQPLGYSYWSATNDIVNGGTTHPDGNNYYSFFNEGSWYVSRCRKAQAEDVFIFFALALHVATLVLAMMGGVRSKRNLGV